MGSVGLEHIGIVLYDFKHQTELHDDDQSSEAEHIGIFLYVFVYSAEISVIALTKQ